MKSLVLSNEEYNYLLDMLDKHIEYLEKELKIWDDDLFRRKLELIKALQSKVYHCKV